MHAGGAEGSVLLVLSDGLVVLNMEGPEKKRVKGWRMNVEGVNKLTPWKHLSLKFNEDSDTPSSSSSSSSRFHPASSEQTHVHVMMWAQILERTKCSGEGRSTWPCVKSSWFQGWRCLQSTSCEKIKGSEEEHHGSLLIRSAIIYLLFVCLSQRDKQGFYFDSLTTEFIKQLLFSLNRTRTHTHTHSLCSSVNDSPIIPWGTSWSSSDVRIITHSTDFSVCWSRNKRCCSSEKLPVLLL